MTTDSDLLQKITFGVLRKGWSRRLCLQDRSQIARLQPLWSHLRHTEVFGTSQ